MNQTGQWKDSLHGIPRRGYVLSSAVEDIARHGRLVVSTLRTAFERDIDMVPKCAWEAVERDVERASWLCFSTWLVAMIYDSTNAGRGLEHSVTWFFGSPLDQLEREYWQALDSEIRASLDNIATRSGVRELLPYILEVHGPGSRLSVMRDPTTQAARSTKKAAGVFYTPPDVAGFMARSVLDGHRLSPIPKVLDPAVGTGVFLRAILKELVKANPNKNAFLLAKETLFGCDIDAVALDGAATVVLADSIRATLRIELTPFDAWQTLRNNLKQIDTLTIDRDEKKVKEQKRKVLSETFPSVREGFDVIIGNPPYASMGQRNDWSTLAFRFQTVAAKPKRTADLYPVFIEQMVRLAGPSARGALVVPLSIACNSGAQFAACRQLIQHQDGVWSFSFYDRQPHALFGEDVKTRNAIVVWKKTNGSSTIHTGPLRKWRGQDRQRMLEQIEYTRLDVNIRAGIPKVHGTTQAALLEDISQEPLRLSHVITNWGRTTLQQVPQGASNELFVAPTAYNFLGIARPFSNILQKGEILSTSPLMRLSSSSATDAEAAYAVLSGNLAFWWWKVHGDGFHVNQATLQSLPIGRFAFSSVAIGELARLGQALWAAAQSSPNRSVNRGKVSYTFSAGAAPQLRREIDSILFESLGQEVRLANELEEYREIVTEARLFPLKQNEHYWKENHDKTRITRDQRQESTDERRVARVYKDGLVDCEQGA